MTEEWRSVPSTPMLEASSLGRVRSIPYEQKMPHGGTQIRQLQPTYGQESYGAKNSRYRRKIIVFRRKTYKVASLVCGAFHGPKPFPSAEVLHGDEDSMNNTPGNVRWGTRKENHNAPGFVAYCKTRTGENNPYVKGRRKKEAQHGH